MLVLVDGHNSLHALGLGKGDHEAARDELLRLVAEAPGEIEVYFDARLAPPGLPPAAGGKRVRVFFCRKGEADEAILARVREPGKGGAVLVVTDDRELAGRARQLGAKTQAVRDFFAEPEAPPPEEKRPGGRDLTPEDFGLPGRVNLKRPPRDLRPGS